MRITRKELRSLILNESKSIMFQDVDDLLDEVIEKAAPEIVRAIKEQEVDEDMDEFLAGAQSAEMDRYEEFEYRREPGKRQNMSSSTKMTQLGYNWGYENYIKMEGVHDVVSLPADIKREMVEYAIDHVDSRITEEFVIMGLEAAYAYGKEQLGDVHKIIHDAYEKYGYKVGVVIVFVEVFEHAILPAMLAAIHPGLAVIGLVPTVEIIAAIALAVAKSRLPEEDPPQHIPGAFDEYEAQSNDQISESTLRYMIRQQINKSF
jgi:hypothetical protein